MVRLTSMRRVRMKGQFYFCVGPSPVNVCVVVVSVDAMRSYSSVELNISIQQCFTIMNTETLVDVDVQSLWCTVHLESMD